MRVRDKDQVMTDRKMPSTPLPATTVLLLRPSRRDDPNSPVEVFMVVRHHKIDSFSGALVFPGGKLETADADPRLRARCAGADSIPDGELAFRVAGIREAFEECGVLLATQRGASAMIGAPELAPIEARWRDRLAKDDASIVDMVEAEDLVLAVDRMTPFAHWITPAMVPKRFDTWFFVAAAPVDQVALHDGSESVDSVWIEPSVAASEADAGRRTMVFPTRQNVLKLGEARNVAEAIAQAKARHIVTVLPWLKTEDDGSVWLNIPPDAGYPINRVPREKMATG